MAENHIPAVPPDAVSALQSDVYLAWVRGADPAALPQAEAAARAAAAPSSRAIFDKPGRYLTEMASVAEGLPPAHRPWFLDGTAHRMLADAPMHAGRAYKAARGAEQGLPSAGDPGWRTAQARLLARYGAFTAPQLGEHHRWLTELLPAEEADRELLAFLAPWSRGGCPLPADLASRLRRSGRAAGHGPERDAAVLSGLLASRSGRTAPEKLLDAAARLFASAPPPDAELPALLAQFPTGVTDGASWLRMLEAAGAFAAVEGGRVALPSGVGGSGPQGPARNGTQWWRSSGPGGEGWTAWLGRFAFRYSYRKAGSGVMAQRMPEELFALLPRLAGWMRADAAAGRAPVAPAVLDASWSMHGHLDAELLDACLAAGVPVESAGGGAVRVLARPEGEPPLRDFAALDADPEFGARERQDDNPRAAQERERRAARERRDARQQSEYLAGAGSAERAALVERVDAEWGAVLGRSTHPTERWGPFLAGAAERPPVSPPVAHVLRRPGGPGGGARLWRRGADGAPVRSDYAAHFDGLVEASVLSWLLTECPVGDPAAARAAEVLASTEDRHWTPGRLLEAGRSSLPIAARAAAAAAFGPGTFPVLPPDPAGASRLRAGEEWDPPGGTTEMYDNGLVLVAPDGRGNALLRTSALADSELVARTRGLLDRSGLASTRGAVDSLLLMYGTGRGGGSLARMVARAAETPVEAGRFEADPAASVPSLVAEVSAETGVGADAARLYLQLLALARPTDRNVRAWNGWSGPAAQRAAVAELAERGLVVEERRERAGRSVFAAELAAPEHWLPLKKPHLPVEAPKLAWYRGSVEDGRPQYVGGPLLRLLAPVPVHELFRAAWEWRQAQHRA